MKFLDYYAVLGVPRFYATQDEIRTAYLAQIRYFHPDANHVPPEIAKDHTQLLTHIYSTLKDPQKKRAYDEKLANSLLQQSAQQRAYSPPQKNYEPAPAPKSQPKRNMPTWFALSSVAFFVALILVVGSIFVRKAESVAPPEPPISANDAQLSAPTPKPTPTPTPKPQKTLTPANLPLNGSINYPIGGYSESESGYLTIKTQGDEHYFIKLRNSRTDKVVLTFFVRAGQTAEVNVPFGEYTLSYACGKQWYGYNDLFGDGTSYSMAKDTFQFKDYGDSVTWWTVELYLQYDGNLDTKTIDPDDF